MSKERFNHRKKKKINGVMDRMASANGRKVLAEEELKEDIN
jgi:ribosomal protein L34